MPKPLLTLPLLLGALFGALLPWTALLAESASTRFSVTAQVAPRVSLQPDSPVRSLSLGAAELARGELELELVYRVAGNDPRGFVVEVAPRLGLAEVVAVEIEGTRAELTDTQLEFVKRNCGSCQLRVLYRVRLREGLAPGDYPLPWQLRVRPL